MRRHSITLFLCLTVAGVVDARFLSSQRSATAAAPVVPHPCADGTANRIDRRAALAAIDVFAAMPLGS